VRGRSVAGDHRPQPGADVVVGVEAEDGVGLRERSCELGAVALGEAADGHDGLRPAFVAQLGRGEQGVDRVLLGGVDEAAGVDEHRVGARRLGDDVPPVEGEPGRELLGVDLVARAAQGHECDRAARRRCATTRRRGWHAASLGGTDRRGLSPARWGRPDRR
jgi:hypothetical protein